jgi:U4/U6.U5 tri-snRNP component SNU23
MFLPADLRKLGQTTIVARSTLAQVRAKIARLREETSSKVTAKNFDFQARLAAVRDAELEEKTKRREERKRKRAERKEGEVLNKMGLDGKASRKEVEQVQKEQDDIAAMMGFGGFGGGKKR